MNALGRRALVAGVLGLGAAEALSLGGAFDHRRTPRPNARERFRASIAAGAACGIVHVGHSTHVLLAGGRRFLTDPWFSDPAFGALVHTRAPACAPEDLHDIDAVLVSHDHPDHADFAALDRVPEKSAVVLVGSRELETKAKRCGYRNVRRLALWEAHDVGGVRVHAIPALHDVPELGFVVATGETSIYFAGDSAPHGHFGAIRERLRPTFAILPVDGTRLRGSSHATMNALDAVRAARELGVRGVTPSHAEARFTDPFAEHALTTSAHAGAELFRREMERALPGVRCEVPLPGAFVAA